MATTNSTENAFIPTDEKPFNAFPGFPMLMLGLATLVAVPGVAIALAFTAMGPAIPATLGVPSFFIGLFIVNGLFTLEPNMSANFLFFGNYSGTSRQVGFLWRNPLKSIRKYPLRQFNDASEVIKVNDATGTPIEIGVVVSSRVVRPASAQFDLDEPYKQFIKVQTESGLRAIARQYPYDINTEATSDSGVKVEDPVSLQSATDQIMDELANELRERFERAGVEVDEVRINHLAYAPEIAQEMLRRQQAAAVIAARKTIAEGAVGIVRDTLGQLETDGGTKMDDREKTRIAGDLLIVLCSGSSTTPVVSVGSSDNVAG